MNSKLWIGIILVLTLITCAGTGIYLYKLNELTNTKVERVAQVSTPKVTDECTEETKDTTMMANSAPKKVSPNATFVMKIEYTKCGHTVKKYEDAPANTVNMTQEELKKMYEDWDIISFTNNEIVMEKKEERYLR